jgi:hypothetical protein
MPVVYHCPHCQQPVSVPDNMLGQAIGCPHCRKPFQTFPPAPAMPPAAPAPAPPPPPPPAKVFSLDDDEEEPPSQGDDFANLDEPPRRRRKRRRDEDEEDDDDRGRDRSSGYRGRGRYKPGQQKMAPSQLFGMIGGILGGVGVTVFNTTNRRPGQGFDPTEILIAAIVGGVCGGVGFFIGKIIEWQSEANQQQRRRRRRDDDDEDD